MEKITRPNRIREALGQIQEQQPPYFREYLRRFQEDPKSRVFAPLAEAYRRLGRLDEAIEICLEGLQHHPDFYGGRVVLAKCYLAAGNLESARHELERVVQAVPENLLGQRLLGDAYLGLRNRTAALHCYKMALLLAPADVALAEKVHDLESGVSVLADETPALAVVPALPETQEELEQEIPPLWAQEAPAAGSGGPEADFGFEPLEVPEPATDFAPLTPMSVDEAAEDEGFRVEHVSAIFESPTQSKKEITTETLGDLYFSQGQYDKALRIFEKLTPRPELGAKIRACRTRLGVDVASLVRSRKIALLRSIVRRARDSA